MATCVELKVKSFLCHECGSLLTEINIVTYAEHINGAGYTPSFGWKMKINKQKTKNSYKN